MEGCIELTKAQREASKQITQFSKVLREMAALNPNLFRNATLYFHGFKSAELPAGFVLDRDWGGYSTYHLKTPFCTIVAFCDESYKA